MNSFQQYKIDNVFPANEAVLLNDVFLVILHASHIPPHLAVSVNGKLFTLTVKGPSIDGDLSPLLRTIHQRKIETVFIKLTIPPVFTFQQLSNEIKKYMLAYPRADVGIATCLNPIRDFCSSVFETETRDVNFIFDLLPKLYEQKTINSCYHLNLDKYLVKNSFYIKKYTVYDVYEEIRKLSAVLSV